MINSTTDQNDPERIIKLSNNIAELDAEYNNWLQNPFDRRKVGDTKCLAKYGCTNTELYNRIRSKLLAVEKPKETIDVSEAGFVNNTYKKQNDPAEIISKINAANDIMRNNPYIIIINDFIEGEIPDYTEQDLFDMYEKFVMLPIDRQTESNSYSQSIWGCSVHDMYKKIKAKFTRVDIDELTSSTDKVLAAHGKKLQSSDFIQHELSRIDSLCITHNRTLTESIILENHANKMVYIPNAIPVGKDIVPYLTPDEYQDLNGVKIINPYSYVNIGDQKAYKQIIHDLQLKLANGEPVEEKILKLGWNPYVKMTGEAVSYAKHKQCKWFSKLASCKEINLSEYDTNIPIDDLNTSDHDLLPIFICAIYNYSNGVKVVKDIGIALDSLRNVSSFNGDGIAYHNFYNIVNEYDIVNISCFFVHDEIYFELKDNLIDIIAGNGELKNLELSEAKDIAVRVFVNKLNSILEDDERERYFLKDFTIYDLWNGTLDNYFPGTCIRKAYAITYCRNKPVEKVTESELPDVLYSGLIENLFVDSYRDNINSILSELRSSIYPESILSVNELRLPFGLDDKGLYINFPKDLQKEYEEAHRLLSMYGTNNIEGIKHELAHLYYLNWVIEKKLKYTPKGSKKYKELIDLRARVLNDFKKYFKIVCAADPDFDFMEYLKTTEYYTKRMEVDYEMLAAIGKIIAKYGG